jgi:nucleoside-diphosphate-sugar epimerase
MPSTAFIIGAGGYVGSYLGKSLAADGWSVSGLARSDAAAETVSRAGMTPLRGDARDGAFLAREAARHDVTIFTPQLMVDEEHAAVTAILDALEGTGKGFIFTSGTGVLAQRTDGDWSEDSFAEDDAFEPLKWISRRVETETLTRNAKARGIRAMVIRPPEIWGHGGGRRVNYVAESALRTGYVAYVGRGLNLYSNVHIDDLVDLFRLAIDKGVAGALYHSVAGEVNQRCICEAIGRMLGLPVRSITLGEGIELWGKKEALITLSVCSRTRSPRSRRELGWSPRNPDLMEDILTGSYRRKFAREAA